MTVTKIEVVADSSVPAGGHAIIRLRGVALLPPGATFRIEPIDDALDEGHDGGWPSGDLTPLETRQTADGVEMRIGPAVVDAPLLEPGTPVTISVPDGHISAELVWPNLPVSTGRAGAQVVMTPSQMAAELAAAERARQDALRAAELATSVAVAAGPPPLATNAVDAGAARVAATDQERMNGAAWDLEAALASEPIDYAGGMMFPGRERERGPDRALSSLNKTVHERVEVMAGAEADTSLPAIVMKRANESAASSAISRGDLRPGTIEGSVSEPVRPGRLMPFLAGAGAAGIAAAAILAVMTIRNGHIPFGATDVATKPVTAAAAKGSIAEVFTAGYQSPRGEIATDVDLPTALRLADYNLHGIDRPVDRAEAEFWLRKAMSLTASHSQLRWAMTQLGTLQAEPVTGAPDYDKARMLWEISATNGDPVAMCFLGTLLEFGLGAAADKGKALDQYKRAKEFGGCPAADEAIARLSK